MKMRMLVAMSVVAGLVIMTGCKKAPLPECVKAHKCCQALNGEADGSCAPLLQSPELTCTTSLTSFRTAVKATKPAQISQCD